MIWPTPLRLLPMTLRWYWLIQMVRKQLSSLLIQATPWIVLWIENGPIRMFVMTTRCRKLRLLDFTSKQKSQNNKVSSKKCGLLKKTPILIHTYRSKSSMMSVSCLLSDVVHFEPLSSISSIFFDDKSFQVRTTQFPIFQFRKIDTNVNI